MSKSDSQPVAGRSRLSVVLIEKSAGELAHLRGLLEGCDGNHFDIEQYSWADWAEGGDGVRDVGVVLFDVAHLGDRELSSRIDSVRSISRAAILTLAEGYDAARLLGVLEAGSTLW